MPHDNNGQLLQPGDKVVIRGTVKSVNPDPENLQFCNLEVELDVPMPAHQDRKFVLSGLNANQVVKVLR